MSVASVSGRIRAQRLSQMSADQWEQHKAAKEAARKAQRGTPSLYTQYKAAWRRAGKPADFPSMSAWLSLMD